MTSSNGYSPAQPEMQRKTDRDMDGSYLIRYLFARRMAAKKTAVEVHKFGGASLGDGAAFRHAVSIIQGRKGAAPVVVVSAPAGITDVLLGLATRAVAGDKSAGLTNDVEALRKRYQ